jgi:hypothetical protein
MTGEVVLAGPARIDGIIMPGRVVLARGRLTLESRPGRWAGLVRQPPVVVHSGLDVQLLRTRLAPPWMNTHLVISDGTRVALAAVPWGTRRRTREALGQAGFNVMTRRCWVSVGGSLIR